MCAGAEDVRSVDPLDEASFSEALAALTSSDEKLAGVVDRHGPPPFWRREPGFATLVWIILEQQVSLASAKAAFDKLADELGTVDPAGLLTLDAGELRRLGFSRQKSRYSRELATVIIDGELQLEELEAMPDDEVRRRLEAVTGIGRWTSDIYLLMALRRPDVWPVGDLALAVATKRLEGLDTRASPPELESIGQRWRPWRAVAARVLWHLYLSERR